MAGKSFLSQQILERFHLPWVSTDIIHKFMRGFVPREQYPSLWEFYQLDLEKYLSMHTSQEVFEKHHRQSIAVWEGVIAWIHRMRNWESYAVEGVAIIPEMVHKYFKDDRHIKSIFLIDNDPDRILAVINTRGLWPGALKYSESANKKYVEWILIFNEWLKKECAKYGYPLIEVGDRSTLLDRVLEVLEIKK